MIRDAINQVMFDVLKAEYSKNIFIVNAQQNIPAPAGDYVTVNQLALIPQDGFGSEYRQIVASTNEDFDFDILDSRKTEDVITVSIGAHSESLEQAYSIANFMHDALDYKYRQEMYDKGYTVIQVLPLQNRTVYQVEKFNYSYGFDVSYRINRTIQRRKDTIEKVEINNEGIDL